MTLPHPNSPDPFATASADDVRDLLIHEIHRGHPDVDSSGAVFRSRAEEMVGLLSPLMVWLRDHRSIRLTPEQCYAAMDLRTLARLSSNQVLSLRDPATGLMGESPAVDLPGEVSERLRTYLGCLNYDPDSYDPGLPYDGQRSDQPGNLHSYAQFYLAHVCQAAPAADRNRPTPGIGITR